jgi:hypothetical protein
VAGHACTHNSWSAMTQYGDTVHVCRSMAMGGMGRTFDGGYAEFTVVPRSQVIPFQSDLPWFGSPDTDPDQQVRAGCRVPIWSASSETRNLSRSPSCFHKVPERSARRNYVPRCGDLSGSARLERLQAGLNVEGAATKRFDSRRLHHHFRPDFIDVNESGRFCVPIRSSSASLPKRSKQAAC